MQCLDESLIKSAIELTLLPGVGIQTQNRIWKNAANVFDIFAEDDKYLETLGVSAEAFSILRSRGFQAIAAEIFDGIVFSRTFRTGLVIFFENDRKNSSATSA